MLCSSSTTRIRAFEFTFLLPLPLSASSNDGAFTAGSLMWIAVP